MLGNLFGSKNIEMILLFLFIHKSCYGAQVSRFLKTSLAPVQKALSRLEEVGVVSSAYHGKSRIYSLNPGYPLHAELSDLIKKAYTLLSPDEKKRYFLAHHECGLKYHEADQSLLDMWEMLQKIRFLTFTAVSRLKTENGWNGRAVGDVIVTRKGHNQLLFAEKGVWQGGIGTELAFSNVFRWTLDRSSGVLSLEHLRHGEERPVFLFHLRPSGKHAFLSQDAHLCGEDAYFGQAFLSRFGVQLNWRIVGLRKNEEIEYRYSF